MKEKEKIMAGIEAALSDKADKYEKSLLIWKKRLVTEQEKMRDHLLKW